MTTHKTISRDEARERVGKALYGDDWIGALSQKDWKLFSEFGPHHDPAFGTNELVVPVCPPGLADKLDRVIGRRERASAQGRVADHWLERHGMETGRHARFRLDGFNATFERELQRVTKVSLPRKRGQSPEKTKRAEAIISDMLSKPDGLAHLEKIKGKELEALTGLARTSVSRLRDKMIAERRNSDK